MAVDPVDRLLRIRYALDMKRQHVSARLGKAVCESERIMYHQMYIDWKIRHLVECRQDRKPEREIVHENAVHHIKMERIDTCLMQSAGFRTDAGKVTVQYGC